MCVDKRAQFNIVELESSCCIAVAGIVYGKFACFEPFEKALVSDDGNKQCYQDDKNMLTITLCTSLPIR